MALLIQKLSASNSAKNVLISFINSSKINIFEHSQNDKPEWSPYKYQFYTQHYSITEIPPPYCSVCNKFMTTNQCNNIIQPKNCPLL